MFLDFRVLVDNNNPFLGVLNASHFFLQAGDVPFIENFRIMDAEILRLGVLGG